MMKYKLYCIVIVFHGITAKAYSSTKKKRCADVNIRCHASLWYRIEVDSEKVAVAGTILADEPPQRLKGCLISLFTSQRKLTL